MRKQKVLFLCTQNSARSQMAEGFLRDLAGDRFEVYSAGLGATDEVHPCAVEAMREAGIDISDQRPKGLKTYMGKEYFNCLIIVCARAEERCPKTFPGGTWDGRGIGAGPPSRSRRPAPSPKARELYAPPPTRGAPSGARCARGPSPRARARWSPGRRRRSPPPWSRGAEYPFGRVRVCPCFNFPVRANRCHPAGVVRPAVR